MRIVAFLPVKGSSSRVPNKNVRISNGEPFFVFTLRKLLNCSFINEVFVDSENETILKTAERIGATPLPRDPALASNRTDGHQLFYNEAKQVDADIYIQHLCTSPFVREETIYNAVSILRDNNQYDSVVLGKADKYYHWENNKPAYNIAQIPNSTDLSSECSEAMALYVVKSESALNIKRRIGDNPKMIFGNPIELIDVNTEDDFKLAEIVGAGILASEEKKLRVLGRFLTSPILSDICDELNLNCILSPYYKSNIEGAKLFGRARTLHIREAKDGDKTDSIYEALQSYKHVVSNDVVVVKNDLPDLAYFGELNMSLSIRSGAIGAIISDVTRDTKATKDAGFPVFAKGNFCKDIKGRGAVESINTPIFLDGVKVEPSDLIFADSDGIVVIPRNHEINILRKAIHVMTQEKNIVADVCQDVNVEDLVEKYGFF